MDTNTNINKEVFAVQGELPVLSENIRKPDVLQQFYALMTEHLASSDVCLRTTETGNVAMRVDGGWQEYIPTKQLNFWRDLMRVYPVIKEHNWSMKRMQALWEYFRTYAPNITFDNKLYFEMPSAILDGRTGKLITTPDRHLTHPTLRNSPFDYDPTYEPSQAWQTWYTSMDAHQQAVRAWSVGSAVLGEYGLLFTFGNTRVGKAERASQLVPTPRGDHMIGVLKPGDYVFGSNGRPTRVIAVHHHGRLPVWRVRFTDGSWLDTSEEHNWTLVRDNRPSIVRTTRELRKKLPSNNYYLPRAIIKGNNADEQVPAYELGAWLADGSVCGSNNSQARITKAQGAVSDYLQAIDPELKRHDYHNSCGYLTASTKSHLREYLRETGLDMTKSKGKFIPSEWFNKTADIRFKLLQGLMDCDGGWHYKKHRYSITRYSTTSPQLALDVIRLATSLGLSARKKIAHHKTGDYFIVNIRGLKKNPFKYSKYVDVWRPCPRTPRRCVKSVEYIGEDEMVCITVEAKDNLYIGDTQFNIVTHNSTLAEGITNVLGRGVTTFNLSQHWGRFYTQDFDNTTYLYDPDCKGAKQKNNENYETLHMMASGDPIRMEMKGGASYKSANYGFLEVVSNQPVPIYFEKSLIDRVRFCLYTYIEPRGDGGEMKSLILADRQAWVNYAISCAIDLAKNKATRPPIDDYQMYGWVQWLKKTSTYGQMCVDAGRALTYQEYSYAYEGKSKYMVEKNTVAEMRDGFYELERQYGTTFLDKDWDNYEQQLKEAYYDEQEARKLL